VAVNERSKAMRLAIMRYIVEMEKDGVISETEHETWQEAVDAMEKLIQAFPLANVSIIDKEKEV
jgi:hypothetical protein